MQRNKFENQVEEESLFYANGIRQHWSKHPQASP
jgi:hypothetical protein